MKKLLNKKKKIDTRNIQLIVYDFDGVMTNNRIILSEDGTESVVVNRSDGLGVSRIHELGIHQLILSTEANPVVKARAQKLGLEAIGACQDKKKALKNYCQQRGYDLRKVIFVGNDLNDLEVMRIVGFPIAPRDACQQILALAKLVTVAGGGEGVIRELSELIIN